LGVFDGIGLLAGLFERPEAFVKKKEQVPPVCPEPIQRHCRQLPCR